MNNSTLVSNESEISNGAQRNISSFLEIINAGRDQQMIMQEERRKEEMARSFHVKNRKKFMHLYQLEKYFR